MKILIRTLSNGIGHQIIDAWHAYVQHLTKYTNDTEYILRGAEDSKIDNCDLSILLDYMGDKITDEMVSTYDMVLICNGGEPIAVASPRLKELLLNNNVYLIANSYLIDHELKSKVIWFPESVMTCRDYWTRHFYPQFYDRVEFERLTRTNYVGFIGGDNRADRAYFFNALLATIPKLKNYSRLGQQISEVGDCQWETAEDQTYREYANSLLQTYNTDQEQNRYYDKSVNIGIADQFGSIPPGYFHLPVYYEYHCVVFFETSWQNNELCITEKSLKCFFSGSLPFPIGGANINKLYNQFGFYTAWNLLPTEFQMYDSITNHIERGKATIDAIKWLHDHPEVFGIPQFTQYVQKNKINFLTCHCDSIAVKNFDTLIRKYLQ
jgi:hypothetical protein